MNIVVSEMLNETFYNDLERLWRDIENVFERS